MENYKEEIQQTRVGCIGSSDGALLAKIGNSCGIPKTALKRLAVLKGFVEQQEIPRTRAIAYGDEIEMAIYNHLSSQKDGYVSNPLWESEKYSRKNVKLIAHPDIVFVDEEKQAIYVYEVKTTKYSFQETKNTYRAQLYIQNVIAREMAEKRGKRWRVKMFLVHYSTEGLDLEHDDCEFDPKRMTINEVRFPSPVFNVERAMDVLDNFLETFNEYYDGDEIEASYLPEKIREEFDAISVALKEIVERETRVDAFKEKLFEFMVQHDIKSIKSDLWSITRVDDSVSTSFDYKKFLEDYAESHPRKHQQLVRKYEKKTKRKGYVKIGVKK